MGHKFSAINGVKSDNFYSQGNAINEIWIGNVELISRLPFGDSDRGQAGWPPGSWPKIPWHQFVIPLKRDMELINTTVSIVGNNITVTDVVQIVAAWQSLEFAFGGLFVTLANALLLTILFSPSLRALKQTMTSICRNKSFPTSEVWIQQMRLAQPHPWLAVFSWLYSFTGTERYAAPVAACGLAVGFPLLFSVAEMIEPFKPFCWTLLTGSIGLVLLVPLHIVCVGFAIWQALEKVREDLEPSSKPEDIEMAAVPV